MLAGACDTALTQLAEEELDLVRQKRTQLHEQIVLANAELHDLREQLSHVRRVRAGGSACVLGAGGPNATCARVM